MKPNIILVFAWLLTAGSCVSAQKVLTTEVLVIGGGTGGTAAAIQSARTGARTMIVEPTPWLGGMISAAGVSAIDGNHRLPSGLWAEFRSRIYTVYGGPQKVETGWVSNTLFEPHVGDSIFKQLAGAEKNLTVLHHYGFRGLQKSGDRITSASFYHQQTGESLTIKAAVFVDATELGDVMAAARVPYDLGMEAGTLTGENVGVHASSPIVQDLTYVALLKDYGPAADCTLVRPANYDPAEFDGACSDYYHDKNRPVPGVNAQKMLEYGKLPRNKYMINWPNYGNDTYLNVVEMSEAEREAGLVTAKETTLRFIYFIQHQLGFKNLGLADDEFPTADRLALIPYHREGRRAKGLVRLTLRHIAEPFSYGDPLYRTGIAVGDYPIDHHHKKNEKAPQHLNFYPVPSFSIPLGALIPQGVANLVVAEKGISVSNVANGTTRLQPCVLLTGQAAGLLAAVSVQQKTAPKNVGIRTVQEGLLKAKAYLLPYIDVPPDHPSFEAIQKIGVTGILKGTGIPYKWANQTWFYPDSLVKSSAFLNDLKAFANTNYRPAGELLTVKEALLMVGSLQGSKGASALAAQHRWPRQWAAWGLSRFEEHRPITRAELAVVLHKALDPFGARAVNHKGQFIAQNHKH